MLDRTASSLVRGDSSKSGLTIAFRMPLNPAIALLASPNLPMSESQSIFFVGNFSGIERS